MGENASSSPKEEKWVALGKHLDDAERAFLESEFAAADIPVRTRLSEKEDASSGSRLTLEVPATYLADAEALLRLRMGIGEEEANAPSTPAARPGWKRLALTLFAFMMGLRAGADLSRHSLFPLALGLMLGAIAYIVTGATAPTSEAGDNPPTAIHEPKPGSGQME